jgi:AraC family transcriptional regulator, ethanolamine operon transcriptional activator
LNNARLTVHSCADAARKGAMPTQSFRTFETFFDAVRHASLRATLLERDRSDWALTHLIVNNVSVQWGQAGGKAVVEGATRPGGLSMFLQTRGSPSFSGNGRRFDELSLMVVGPGEEFCLAADASSRRWCSLYIPNEKLAGTTASMRGVFQLPPQRVERFRSFIEQLDQTVHQAPAAFDSAASQGAAEQKLVCEVRHVLSAPRAVELALGRHAVPRRQIIGMSMDFVDQHDGERLSVEQLASAAGVSERTLRDAFHQYFGVAPVQYLNRRTLHHVRAALKAADPSRATVTDIATQFGVWQFGRFARDYRFLFRELPSETLRHQH